MRKQDLHGLVDDLNLSWLKTLCGMNSGSMGFKARTGGSPSAESS